ncbi:hypothetical protein ACO0QE_002196 [Hanseniaspora vineae]
MGFIVPGVNTREIKRADENNLTLLSNSAYYPYLHHNKRALNSGTQKHVSSGNSTDRPDVSVKKHRRSNTEHTEVTGETQSEQARELVVPSLPTETETDTFRRAEAMNYIFNKPITRFINEEGTRKATNSSFKAPFVIENAFPEYFLKSESDFHKYFVPYLKNTNQNVVFEKLMDKSPARIILNHPETVINMLVTGMTDENQMREMLMKVRNLATSETDQQNMAIFHLSATPLILAVQRHGKSKDRIQRLLQSLLDLYVETNNEESLSDDSLWFLLISDSELQQSNEMIWNAGGRPSATVMNNFI